MGENNFGVSNAISITFFNRETNEQLFSTDCIREFDVQSTNVKESIPTIEWEWNENKGVKFEINRLDENSVRQLLTPSEKEIFKLEMNGKYEVRVQAKKHKSKRINKKWLKKYGYKTILKPIIIEIPKCHIKDVDNLREFSFEGHLK